MDSSVASDLLASAVTTLLLRYKFVWFHAVQLFMDSFKMLAVVCASCRRGVEKSAVKCNCNLAGKYFW